MTHPRIAVTAATLIGVCAIGPLLSGCTPISEKLAQLDRFADAVGALPFVTDVSTSSNQPLPYSLNTAMTIVLAAGTDRADIDELHELTCSSEMKTSPAIELDYTFAGGAVLIQEGLYRCWKLPAAFVEALPVLTPHEAEFSRIEWTESTGDDGAVLDLELEIESADDPAASTVASSVALGGALLAALADDGSTVQLSTRGMSIPTGSLAQARASAALAADLVSRFPVIRVNSDDDEGLFVELSTDAPGATGEVRDYLAEAYPAVTVKAVVDATDAVGSATPGQELLDAATTVRESALAESLEITDRSLSVHTASMAANGEIARLLESRGYGDTRVSYGTALDGGASIRVAPRGSTPVTVAQLDDAATIVAALHPTGKLGSVSYEPRGLRVYLADEFYDDKRSVAEFTEIIRGVLAAEFLVFDFVELDNRPLGG